jgi:hypothetical protein
MNDKLKKSVKCVPRGKVSTWEVIVTVSEVQLFYCTVVCTLYGRATRHVLTRVAKCTDVDGGIFETVLY